MKTETREIYKCEHCNKLYQIKSYCLTHEKVCKKNPDNKRACFGCIHLSKKIHSVEHSHGEYQMDILHCEKLESFLYPPKIEIEESWYETDPIENNPMPRTCDMFSDGYIDVDVGKFFHLN